MAKELQKLREKKQKPQQKMAIAPQARAPTKHEKQMIDITREINPPGSYKEAVTGKQAQNNTVSSLDKGQDILVQISAEIKSLNESNRKIENRLIKLENNACQASKYKNG